MKKHIGEAVVMLLVVAALIALLTYDSTSGLENKPAPEIIVQQHWNLPEDHGEKIDIASFKGKVVLLDFWATWCQPCVQSIPHLKKLHEDYADKGLVIIGYTDNSSQSLDHFIESYEIPYIIAVGPSMGAYEIFNIPQVALIDKKGVVRLVGHPSQLRNEAIEALLAE